MLHTIKNNSELVFKKKFHPLIIPPPSSYKISYLSLSRAKHVKWCKFWSFLRGVARIFSFWVMTLRKPELDLSCQSNESIFNDRNVRENILRHFNP